MVLCKGGSIGKEDVPERLWKGELGDGGEDEGNQVWGTGEAHLCDGLSELRCQSWRSDRQGLRVAKLQGYFMVGRHVLSVQEMWLDDVM